jgi:hypothetical protein
MSKLTITIPEELSDRLEKVRDKFVISKVCQVAIDREVKIQELVLSSITNDVIERLKLQKSKLVQSSREKGRTEGIKIARYMSYTQLIAILEFKGLHFFEDTGDYTFPVKELIGLVTSHLSEEEQAFQIDESGDTCCSFEDYMSDIFLSLTDTDFYEFFVGFVDGVLSFYDSIKADIGDECKIPVYNNR